MSSRVFPRPSDLVPLVGARMVQASEPEEGAQQQERMIKDLTAGEPLAARGVDDGVWREVTMAPYDIRPCASDEPESGES